MLHSFSAAAVVTIAVLATASAAAAQDSKSAPLARELAKALDAAKLQTIGAADPETGGFVAAIYVPGTQLLVVGGKFRELYMDLNGGAVPDSRWFASDILADGLVLKPSNGSPADAWEAGTSKLEFAGAKKAKLKDDEYHKAYSDADMQYARILSLLIAQAKAKGSE
jgi:hypothetical protein